MSNERPNVGIPHRWGDIQSRRQGAAVQVQVGCRPFRLPARPSSPRGINKQRNGKTTIRKRQKTEVHRDKKLLVQSYVDRCSGESVDGNKRTVANQRKVSK